MDYKIKKKVLWVILIGSLLTSCSKDKEPAIDSNTVNTANGNYIVLTAESGSGAAGYYAAYQNMPTGEVDNIGGFALQARAYGGFRHFGKWLFNRATLAGETGVVRYTLNSSGKLEQNGFIKCGTSAQHLVVNETTGFYFDADRGKTKIQKFNPTTMKRTGEIDLSPIIERGSGISSNVFVGNQTIAAKEGKLYVNITYSRNAGSGHNDNTRKYTLALIDIATEKLEKTIVHEFVKNQGHSPSEYPAWIQAKDGTLYFVTTGWDYNEENTMKPQASGIFRIKAGETDFDKNWFLNGKTIGLTGQHIVWSIKDFNGKLYVDVSQQVIDLPSFSNLMNNPIFDIFAVDPNNLSGEKTKISGIPSTIFGHSTGNFEVVDDQLFIRTVNVEKNFNGYYKLNLDGKSANPAFTVKRGGQIKGFNRLFADN